MSALIWASVCAFTALALVCHGSASRDDPMEQREVTFNIHKLMKDQDMLQRELDPSELLIEDQHMLQRELDPSEFLIDFEGQKESDTSKSLSNFKHQIRPKQPIGFSPRARRPHHYVQQYPVDFPLARPSSKNIQSICLHGDRRPRYPESYFPASGFGVQKRQADAVNMLEAWFGMCCGQNQTEEVLLCCATQAWEKSIRLFCEEGFTIKAPHFHCCKLKKGEVLPCFDSSAQNPDYNPTQELPVQPVAPKANFSFDPSSCSRTSMTPHSIRTQKKGKKEKKPATSLKVDLDFPLAVPTDSNSHSICHNLRPHYNTKCLNGLGYKLVAHQAKSITNLEKEFKLCCRKKEGVLPCLQLSWKNELKQFCSICKRKRIDYRCCDGGVPQFDCLENVSTDPSYNKTITDGLSLKDVCDTHKIMKKGHVGFPLKSVVNKCCHLSPTERTACVSQSVKEQFETTCSSRKSSSPSVQRCCRSSSAECFNKVLMDAITKATIQKNKKRCPVVAF